MKYCPCCGSKNLNYKPWLGEIYVCRKCGYQGAFVVENGEVAEAVAKDFEIKDKKDIKNGMGTSTKIMKKKIVVSVLIVVTITAVLICIILGIMIKSSEPPPVTPPGKFEYVDLKFNESKLVWGNYIKVISIEEKEGILKIQCQNKTTGETAIGLVPHLEVGVQTYGPVAFKFRNMAIIPGKVEDNRITLLIVEVAYYEENKETNVYESKLVDIALNDTGVKEEIGNWSYEIGNIVYMEYEARNGELKIKGNFPVVPLYLGTKNESGVTLLVFINPDDETVIDVGHDYRRVELPY